MTLDSIDRLLELLDLQTRIEVYCHLQAPFHMVHEPDTPGTAWFHLLLEGSCTIATGGHQYALQAGDFFMLTAGSQHTIYAGEGNSAFRQDTRNGLLQLCNDSGGEPLRMLCGIYQVRNRAAVSLLGILPEPLLVSLGDIAQLPALCTLIHHEALARRQPHHRPRALRNPAAARAAPHQRIAGKAPPDRALFRPRPCPRPRPHPRRPVRALHN